MAQAAGAVDAAAEMQRPLEAMPPQAALQHKTTERLLLQQARGAAEEAAPASPHAAWRTGQAIALRSREFSSPPADD